MPDVGVAEVISIKGRISVYSRPKSDLPWDQGQWDLEYETPNLIVTSGKALVAAMLAEESGYDTGITYCEVGTDNTTPNLSDTALGSVTKRNAITRTIRGSNVVQFRTFYAAADVSVYLKEMGLFGHSTATSTNGTGELFNRAIIDLDNSSGSKDLTIVAEITFG